MHNSIFFWYLHYQSSAKARKRGSSLSSYARHILHLTLTSRQLHIEQQRASRPRHGLGSGLCQDQPRVDTSEGTYIQSGISDIYFTNTRAPWMLTWPSHGPLRGVPDFVLMRFDIWVLSELSLTCSHATSCMLVLISASLFHFLSRPPMIMIHFNPSPWT